jgi:hypothetical protein
MVNHGKGTEKSSDVEHIADGPPDSSKNQLAAAGVDPLGEAENGTEARTAQVLQFVEVEDHALATGAKKTAAMSFKQARSDVVEAALGGDHFGIFQLPVGEFKHGDLLSPDYLYYPSAGGKLQPADG